jgi:hypothetical protein
LYKVRARIFFGDGGLRNSAWLRVSPTGRSPRWCHILQVKPRSKVIVTKLEPPLLKKGQVWNMQDEQLLIHRMGKHLVEFRILKLGNNPKPQRLTRSSLETVTAVQNYLQTKQAVLEPAANGE